MMWAIFALHFMIPFFLLLMRPIKRNSTAVAAIAGLIVFMQLVFVYYQVTPDISAGSMGNHWMDFLTPIGIGGIWLAYFVWQLQRLSLLRCTITIARSRCTCGNSTKKRPPERRTLAMDSGESK